MTDHSALKPLVARDGEPVFEEAWQAEALAMANLLVENGLIPADQWSKTLGAALDQAHEDGAADNQLTYYQCVLEALERVIDEKGLVDREHMASMRQAWEQAYRDTPHGQPVKLRESGKQL